MTVSPPVAPVPATIVALPPTPLLKAVAPADIVRWAPTEDTPAPEATDNIPAFPSVESPVLIIMAPEEEVSEDPVDTVIEPLLETEETLPSDAEPLAASDEVDTPEIRATDPPELSVPAPATNDTSPPSVPKPAIPLSKLPFDEPLAPTESRIPPARLPEIPEEILMSPEDLSLDAPEPRTTFPVSTALEPLSNVKCPLVPEVLAPEKMLTEPP